MKQGKNSIHGFSTVELIGCLLVIALVGVLVVQKSMQSNVVEIQSQAEVIKSHLRYAQARAMSSTTTWSVTFAATSYTLSNTPSTSPVLPGVGSSTASLPAGMTITTGTVSFDSWGIPHTADPPNDGNRQNEGEKWRTFTLSKGTSTELIKVYNNTGFIP